MMIVLAGLMIFVGCATIPTNDFAKYDRKNPMYKEAKRFCKNTASKEDYDSCMNKEWPCAKETTSFIIAKYGTVTRQNANRVALDMNNTLKANGLYKRTMRHECGYCEMLEALKKDW